MDTTEAILQLGAARSKLEEWQTPEEFSKVLENIRPALRRGKLLYVREGKWFREAWSLNSFAKFTQPKLIRLNHDDPPDGFLRYNESQVPVEVTEVLEPGRKPSLEYQDEAPQTEFDPGENWVRRAGAIPSSLRRGIREKLNQNQSSGTELLVYLNIDEYGIWQRKIDAAITSILTGPTGTFAAIHVLWKEKLFNSTGEVRSHSDPLELEDLGDDEEIFRCAVSSDA